MQEQIDSGIELQLLYQPPYLKKQVDFIFDEIVELIKLADNQEVEDERY
jgi:hypothetical protein